MKSLHIIFCFIVKLFYASENLYLSIPYIETPLQFTNEASYNEEKDQIDRFEDLPPYVPLKLKDMDTKDPLFNDKLTQ